MTKQGFSIFSIHELLASPRLRPVIERLHPAAVLMTVKGVYDDVTREMFSAVGERRIPEIADLTDKILARLLDVEQKGNRLLIDARGVLFPTPETEPPLGRSVLDEMIWRLDLPEADSTLASKGEKSGGKDDWLEKIIPSPERVARTLSSMTGAEDALLFGSAEQAEIALLNAYGRKGTILLARRDFYEDAAGRRFEDRLNFCTGKIRSIGAANAARVTDFSDACDESVSLIWLAAPTASDLKPTLSDADVQTLRQTVQGWKIPIVCRLDFVSFVDLSPYFITPVPMLSDRIASGCDLILTGTGRLIGGPDCGALLGSKRFLDPLRALRLPELFPPNRADLAGLAQTLECYRNRSQIELSIPVLTTVMTSPANLSNRAERLVPQLAAAPSVERAEQRSAEAFLYPGGSTGRMPTVQIAVRPKNRSVSEWADTLRRAAPGIETIAAGDELRLDLKTVPARYDSMIVQIFEKN